MRNILDKPLPPPLPTTREEFLAHRKVEMERTLNDYVEEIYLQLTADKDFRAYLEAVWDEDAMEGSLGADNIMSAMMIRDVARKVEGGHPIAKKKLATIAKSLGVVLRRYTFDRKARRNMVHGEVVPNPADHNNGSE